MMKSWVLRVDLAEELEMGPPLSLALSPDHEVLEPASGARLGSSSDRAEDTSSLGKMDVE